MPRRRSLLIPQRLRVLFSCEGQSERAYGRWLHNRAEQAGLHVHIDARICRPPGGGDLLGLVHDTIAVINRAERDGVPYAVRGLLLDTDMRGRSNNRDQKAQLLARRHRLHIVWQEPDHEAFLLRHLLGFHAHRPAPGQSMAALRRQLPNYQKPWDANALEPVFDLEALRRAVQVEQALREFLAALRWTP